MVKSALKRIGRILDLFNEEVQEDANIGNIVDAMAFVLSQADLVRHHDSKFIEGENEEV